MEQEFLCKWNVMKCKNHKWTRLSLISILNFIKESILEIYDGINNQIT